MMMNDYMQMSIVNVFIASSKITNADVTTSDLR